MNKKTVFSTLICLVLGISASAQNWFEIQSGTGKKLNTIVFPSSNIGYIGGNDSLLLKTTDGGQHWNPISYSGINFMPGGEHILNLKFTSELIGYMTIGPYTGTYKTTDGGLTWTSIDANAVLCYNKGLYFFDENNGFIGGSGCFLGETISRLSGGVWTEATLNSYTMMGLNYITDIDFRNNNLGLAVSRSGYVYRTTDGGLNWDSIPSSAGPLNELTSVLFVNDTLAYAGYTSDNVGFGLYQSTDGGLSWHEDMNSATFLYPDFLCLHRSGNGHIYSGINSSSMSSGGIFENNGDFTSWNYELLEQNINSISSYNDSIVFAVGDSGYVICNVNFGTAGIQKELETIKKTEVYPNPVQDVLHVSLASSLDQESAKIMIFNALGERLLEGQFQSDIDLSNFEKGVYLLKIQVGTELFTHKIIRQ